MICLLIHISFLALITTSDHQKTYFRIILLICSCISLVAGGRILNLACLARFENVQESTFVTPCHPGAIYIRTSQEELSAILAQLEQRKSALIFLVVALMHRFTNLVCLTQDLGPNRHFPLILSLSNAPLLVCSQAMIKALSPSCRILS